MLKNFRRSLDSTAWHVRIRFLCCFVRIVQFFCQIPVSVISVYLKHFVFESVVSILYAFRTAYCGLKINHFLVQFYQFWPVVKTGNSVVEIELCKFYFFKIYLFIYFFISELKWAGHFIHIYSTRNSTEKNYKE